MLTVSLIMEKEMSEPSIRDRVIALLAKQSKTSAEKIGDDWQIRADLALDSLDEVELIMETEEEFTISISENEADEIITVRELIDAVERKVGAKSS